MNRSSILVIGSLNYDMFLHVQRMPVIGETYPADGLNISGGGKGANQAVQCTKLGLKTYMAGSVGDDSMGAYLRASVERYGVDTTYLRTSSEPSGMASVYVFPDAKVCAAIVRGANFDFTREDIDALVPVMQEAFAVVLQLEIPLDIIAYIAEKAHEAGSKVILNAAPAHPLADETLKLCDVFMANEVEATFYTGRSIVTEEDAKASIGAFCEKYGFDAIFTLGEKGAVGCSNGEVRHIPCVKTKAVETTGAGDSFAGGFIKGIHAGLDFWQAANFAAHCSAVTVANIGGQDSMPTLAQVEQYLM